MLSDDELEKSGLLCRHEATEGGKHQQQTDKRGPRLEEWLKKWVVFMVVLCTLVLLVSIYATSSIVLRDMSRVAGLTETLRWQVDRLAGQVSSLGQQVEVVIPQQIEAEVPKDDDKAEKDSDTQCGNAAYDEETVKVLHCPRDPEAARKAGCFFDIFSYGWHPPECFDKELYDWMLAREFAPDQPQPHNWTWRLPPPDGPVIPMSELLKGTTERVYTTWDWHLAHCRYALLKVTRSHLSGSPWLDEWAIANKHTQHCAFVLRHHEFLALDAMVTTDTLWYPQCGKGHKGFTQGLRASYDDDANAELRGVLATVLPNTSW